jgi:hypothetical protein
MTLTNPNFSLYDANIQCLMRQEVRFLSEILKNGLLLLFVIYMPRYPTSHPASPKTLKNTQLRSYIISHKLYVNVLVIV